MDRRTFISSMTLTILAAPLAAEAQPAGNMRRIGVLSAASSVSPPSPQYEAFRQGCARSATWRVRISLLEGLTGCRAWQASSFVSKWTSS